MNRHLKSRNARISATISTGLPATALGGPVLANPCEAKNPCAAR